MNTMMFVSFLIKWAHLVFGVAWIGMLYYFNFVQTEYFKEASESGLSDAKAKLAPRALAWFRWAAKFTFVTGVVLLIGLHHQGLLNDYIILGSILGTLMFINVMAIIWPKQKVVLGLKEGDPAVAAPKAALASRTNTLFSIPMLFFMVASHQMGYSAENLLSSNGNDGGLWLAIAIVLAVEANAIWGKMGPITSIRGVIYCGLVLTAVLYCITLFL